MSFNGQRRVRRAPLVPVEPVATSAAPPVARAVKQSHHVKHEIYNQAKKAAAKLEFHIQASKETAVLSPRAWVVLWATSFAEQHVLSI